jgi:drug/metabolite transporter, DME family
MYLGIVCAILQALAWAVTGIVLRNLSTHLDPFLVNGIRALVGMVTIIPLVFLTGAQGDYALLTLPRVLLLAGSIALGGVIGDALLLGSLKTLGMGRAFPITNTYPLFTVLFSALLLGEKITLGVLAGLVLVMLGIYLVARPRSQVETLGIPLARRDLIRGVAMGVGTAMFWGLASVLLSIGLRNINAIVANSVRVPVVVLLCLGAAAGRGQLRNVRRLSWRTLGLLALGGILGWSIGGSLFVVAVQLAGPSKVAIISASSPLFAVPLGMLFLHERPTRYTLAGTLLSVLGIALVVV